MATFWREVAQSQCMWTLVDRSGQAIGIVRKGTTYRLLWSTSFRLRRALANNPEYADYVEMKLSWQQFRNQWMPMIERNGELIAMDRVRKRLFAFEPSVVQSLVEFEIKRIAERNS
jgi:uncharacterized protein DUF2750